MSYVSPIYAILDGDVLATTMVVLAGAVDGGAVVAGASEEVLLMHVVAGEDVKSVAPTIPAHHLGILYGNGVAAAYRKLCGEWSVDIDILGISNHDALVVPRHYDAMSDNLDISRTISG